MDPKAADILLVAKARRLAATGAGARAREAAGLSLSEVAAAVGVSVSALWRWEHGQRAPRGPQAAAWARLMDDLQQVVA
jgi:DNA-binding transcriptional regulator YiaG